MAIYSTSRNVGWNACSNPNWSSFMNSYASTPFSTTQSSGMSGTSLSGAWSITAPYSGTYTMTAACDDTGNMNFGGNSFTLGGFSSSGNTSSRFYSQGQSISWSWFVQNSTSADTFADNPCAISFALDGPNKPPAPSVSLSASPSSIIRGNCSTLSWSASGSFLTGASLTGVSSPGFGGSTTVCPNSTTTYTYVVTGEGGTSSVSRTITVYIPPNFTLTADSTEIAAGSCTTVRWTTTGDANTLTWLSGNISNGNLNSNSTVCPTDTTTYTGRVSGLGGEDTESITITVNQVPTGSLSVPETLLYGQQGTIQYETQYANASINLKIYFRNNFGTTLAYDYDLPVASSTQLSAPDNQTIRSGSLNTNVIYDDFGPRYIDYVFSVSGSGGSFTRTSTTTIIIDETPDNMVIEETEGKFKSENPVYTPDVLPEEAIESQMYMIEGVDIPVEIKSNKPIQVDINKEGLWQNIREI
jgi:hypothetical protein